MRALTEDVFLKDVEQHAMTVLLDNGLYRHLRFKSTGQHPWNQWFDIVTWPGYLAYSGDMGTFVFARLEDMFEFFRTRHPDDKVRLSINPQYWAEKLEAVDRDHRNNSERAYSEDRFRELVEKQVAEWVEDYSLIAADEKELREAVDDDVLRFRGDGEHEAHRALRDFSAKIGGHTFEFSDPWEWDLREYTFRFLWCCYALTWSIQQYDAAAVPVVPA